MISDKLFTILSAILSAAKSLWLLDNDTFNPAMLQATLQVNTCKQQLDSCAITYLVLFSCSPCPPVQMWNSRYKLIR